MSTAPTPVRAARPTRFVGLLAALALVTGCTSTDGGTDSRPSPRPSAPGPGEAHLDLSGLPVPRGDICGLLADDDVRQALAGPVVGTDHYGNGDELEVTPGRFDISHEYGCVFRASDGTTVRTWTFARPVLEAEATSLVRAASRADDCAYPESVRFGTPSLTSVCEVAGVPGTGTDGGPVVRARLEGLFGDTWMGCEVAEPLTPAGSPAGRADVVQRAEQWCTDVVTTVAAS